MKKNIIISVVLLVIGVAMCIFGAIACGGNFGFASAKTLEYTEQTYDVESDISAIDFQLQGDYNFVLKSGENCKLEYSKSEISTFSISEENGVLKVTEVMQWKNFVQSWFIKTEKTDFVLTVPDGAILALECSFNGAVTAELPAWEYADIDFDVSGSVEIKTAGNIIANDVEFDISGYGKLDLSGTFNVVDIKTSGGSNVNMQGSATSISISASGSSTFNSDSLQCDAITVKASGGVAIDLKGSGKTFVANVSGGSRIDAGEFTLTGAELYVSGGAVVTVNASEKILARVSGGAIVYYYGDPQIDKSVSGGANFRKLD